MEIKTMREIYAEACKYVKLNVIHSQCSQKHLVQKFISVDSELEWLKALHTRVREERKTHAGLGWLDVRIKDHIRELEEK